MRGMLYLNIWIVNRFSVDSTLACEQSRENSNEIRQVNSRRHPTS